MTAAPLMDAWSWVAYAKENGCSRETEAAQPRAGGCRQAHPRGSMRGLSCLLGWMASPAEGSLWHPCVPSQLL